jgi:hypothetical protein
MMKTTLFVLAVLLSGCGGGYETRMMVTWDATAPAEVGFDSTISPPGLDAAQSIASQLRAPGDLMLSVPGAKDGDYAPALEHLVEAAKHERFKWVYVHDEMFWTRDRGIVIGHLEDQITEAARYVKAYGLKSAVSILPEVVLHPDFRLKDPQVFDVIAIDVYPSMGIDWNPRGCRYSENLYSTMLHCSIRRLRALGYTGEVWYIYQSFGLHGDAQLAQRLAMQRITIEEAPLMGVTGLVSWGYTYSSAYEPELYPLKGTPYAPLVNCEVIECGAMVVPFGPRQTALIQ